MALLMFGHVRTARGLHGRMPRTFWSVHLMFLSVPGEWHWMGMYRAVVLCSSSCILWDDRAFFGMALDAARCTDTAPNRFPLCGSWLLRSFSNQYGCREKTTVNVFVEKLFSEKKRFNTHNQWTKPKHEYIENCNLTAEYELTQMKNLFKLVFFSPNCSNLQLQRKIKCALVQMNRLMKSNALSSVNTFVYDTFQYKCHAMHSQFSTMRMWTKPCWTSPWWMWNVMLNGTMLNTKVSEY